jgi:dihydroorotate dehydrogenase electron transfer subunit
LIRAIARVKEADPTHLVVAVPGWPGHRPGQFAMLSLDPGGRHLDPLLPRPMAVYRGSSQGLEFRFKVVGRGTRILSELRPDSEIGIVGPLGRGFPEPSGRPLLVGGGTGIASLYELAAACGSEARVLLGGRTASDILGLDDFRALAAPLEVTTDDGSAGRRGLVTDVLEPKPGDEVFACGPTPMMRRAFEIARAAGTRCWVSLENTMACGFGICLGCGVPADGRYRYVCTDGPVFDAALLDWEGLP